MPRKSKKSVQVKNAQLTPKKSKKKSKNGWASLLGTVAKTAMALAPEVLPLLLASHGPTKAAVRGMPAAQQSAVGSASAPLAVSGSLGNQAGIKDIVVVRRDSRGNALRVRVTTMDLVTQIAEDAASAGDLLFECFVNPLDPAFQGTKFAEFGSQYQLFRVRKGMFVYEPTCPATATGAISACIFDDPSTPLPAGLEDKLRVVASQAGAETWQTWETGCACVVDDSNANDYFVNPAGSDIRFTFQGKLAAIAAADLDGTGGGNLYWIAETEYEMPTLANPSGVGAYVVLSGQIDPSADPNDDSYTPFGVPPSDIQTDESIIVGTGPIVVLGPEGADPPLSVTGTFISGLPGGYYRACCVSNEPGGGIGSACGTYLTAGLVNAGGVGVQALANSSAVGYTQSEIFVPFDMPVNEPQIAFQVNGSTMLTSQCFLFQVNKDATSLPAALSKDAFVRQTLQGRMEAQYARSTAMCQLMARLAAKIESRDKAAAPLSASSKMTTVTRRP